MCSQAAFLGFAALTLALTAAAQFPKPVLPSAQLVGSTVNFNDPVDPDAYSGPFLKQNWTGGKISSDMKWWLPAGYWYEPSGECSLSQFATAFSSFEEFQLSMHAKFVFSSSKDFGLVSSTSSQEMQAAIKASLMGGAKITEAVVTCENWRITALEPQIDPEIKNMILKLPRAFNASTKAAYFGFFELVAPFVITSCHVGGRLQQGYFTETSVASLFDSQSMEKNAQLSFLWGLDGGGGGGGSHSSVNAKWKSATSIESITSLGGDFPGLGKGAWGKFAESVQVFNANLKCNSFKAQLQTDFYHLEPELVPYIGPVFEAAVAYYTIPGCTNPAAVNYNPKANKDDGSCVGVCMQIGIHTTSPTPHARKLMEWPSARSFLWLYEDQTAASCVISYAIEPSGLSSGTVRGTTGTVSRGPQTLFAQRSAAYECPCNAHYIKATVNGASCDASSEESCATKTNFKNNITAEVSLEFQGKACCHSIVNGKKCRACPFAQFAYLAEPHM